MKQDKRFIKTEKLIHDAFFEVLKNENYNSVTVDKICKKALIGKNTFYSHYKNKDDLLFSEINSFSQDFGLYFKDNPPISDASDDQIIEIFIEYFFFSIKNREEEYLLLMKNDNQVNFSERLLISGRNFYFNHLKKTAGPKATEIKNVLLIDSLAAAIIRLQKGYLLHRNEVSLEEVVDLAKASYKDVVKQINSFSP